MKQLKNYETMSTSQKLDDIKERINKLNPPIINNKMNTKDLTNYKPYSIGRYKDDYADVIFESEGIMTVPKSSAQTIVDLLNVAFKNGVTMTIKNLSTSGNGTGSSISDPIIKSKPMPQEEPHPINSYKKR
jgi:hypothetical protein